MKIFAALLFFLSITYQTFSNSIQGKITDNDKNPLPGATIIVKDIPKKGAYAGMDGTYKINNIPEGKHQVTVKYLGFKNFEKEINITANKLAHLDIQLESSNIELESITTTAQAYKNSDAEARYIEKSAIKEMNIISAKSIELSPDQNVANVIMRVSGVSLEKNPGNSGSGENFTIIRGMPKRYNYALVNGIKIPSPEDKNRYVSLDLFPSELLDRVELIKSLTPEYEGDAVGGAVNLVMKSAPDKPLFNVKVATGYHDIFFERQFKYADTKAIADKSPIQLYGADYIASPKDFTTKNMDAQYNSFNPDIYSSISVGQRFWDDKLGGMVALLYDNYYKGSHLIRFSPDIRTDGSNLPVLTDLSEREYNDNIKQIGINSSFDYRFDPTNSIKFYAMFLRIQDDQVRFSDDVRLWGVDPNDSKVHTYTDRFRSTTNTIYNFTLRGDHRFDERNKIDWTAAYSSARKDLPDEAYFVRVSNYSFVKGQESILIADLGDNVRTWKYNTDKDISGYLNYTLDLGSKDTPFELKLGGMYRNKKRTSFIVDYHFNPDPGYEAYGYDWKPDDPNFPQYATWEKFSDLGWKIRNPQGDITQELNYNAHENIGAGYVQFNTTIDNAFQFIGGARIENTDQGYTLLYPRNGQTPTGSQKYTDVLPSLSINYIIDEKSKFRFSYYYAIVRPGYFEIVPYLINEEDYYQVGNPDLKRTKANNFSLRYENFFNSLDQVMIGVFYKKIDDPIENALLNAKVIPGLNINAIVKQPENLGTATNYGFEFNYIKYFSNIGVQVNYTYTHSSITSPKTIQQREDPNDPTSSIISLSKDQTRPLQGQADHIGNLSLLYRNFEHNLFGQLAFVYTGERISGVSNFYDNDEWETPFWTIDLSGEAGIFDGVDIFFKINNLLNNEYKLEIKRPVQPDNATFPYQDGVGTNYKTLIDLTNNTSFKIGFKYKM